MAIVLESIALYHQLKVQGVLDGVVEVLELGAQDVVCAHHEQAVIELYKAFGVEPPARDKLAKMIDSGPARAIYEGLGIRYACVDANERHGAVVMDLNFDPVPDEHKNRYDLVTNHGTSEHVCNQAHVFGMIHDFTKPNGLILHVVPSMGIVDHGFFNYQPNFFDALARHNSYETLGMWLSINGGGNRISSMIPWSEALIKAITLNPGHYANICVLHRKMHDLPFCVPFQEIYEGSRSRAIMDRYRYVVDGKFLDGDRVRHLRKVTEINGRELLGELIKNRIPTRIKYTLKKMFGG